jgi:hypothetical protein
MILCDKQKAMVLSSVFFVASCLNLVTATAISSKKTSY